MPAPQSRSALLLLAAAQILGCDARGRVDLTVPGQRAAPAHRVGPPLLLNEVMRANDSFVMDDAFDFDPWLEVLATGPGDHSGWTLRLDGESDPWTLPDDPSLDAGSHLLLWLDGEPEQGPLHAPFALDPEGGTLRLCPRGAVDADCETWEVGDVGDDVVLGRFPDGGPQVATSIQATPGNANPSSPGDSTDPSDALFRTDRVVRIDLYLPQSSRDSLEQDPHADVPGSLAVGGAWISPVGVRIKGMLGSFRPLSAKSALRVSIDRYLPGRRLRGLEALTLNNMVQDPSCVHEVLAYDLMREAGVPAPRTGYVALFLDGEYRGLYLDVETEDDPFIERWFGDDSGNLYEGVYGVDLLPWSVEGFELDEQGSGDVADRSDLLELAELLAQEPSEAIAEQVESLLHLQPVMRMLATEVLLGHWDGYFYSANNYRIYHEPSSGRFALLPWGIDQTFAWIGGTWDPGGQLARWCLAVPSLEREYRLALWEMAERLADADVEARAWAAWDVFQPSLAADPYKEFAMADAQAAVGWTIEYARTRPAQVQEELFPGGAP